MDQCSLCKKFYNPKIQSSDCPHSFFPHIQREHAMRIEELERKSDWQGLRDYAKLTNNKVAAELANAKADALYAKENPYTYSCPACTFSSRERRIFAMHLEDEHGFRGNRAQSEADRQEKEQTGK